jgi:hypothetical protein
MTSSRLSGSRQEASPTSHLFTTTAFVLAPVLVALLIVAAVVAIALRTRRRHVCSTTPRLPDVSWPVPLPLKHNAGVCSYFSIGDEIIVSRAELTVVVPKPVVSGTREEATSDFEQLPTLTMDDRKCNHQCGLDDRVLQSKCHICNFCSHNPKCKLTLSASTPENSQPHERSLLMLDDQIKTDDCNQHQQLSYRPSGQCCGQNIDEQRALNSVEFVGPTQTFTEFIDENQTRHEQVVGSSPHGVRIETTHDRYRTTVLTL